MNKQEFLDELRRGLRGLPNEDVEERLTFYSEMIDDRMEEGFSEEEAVSEAGSPQKIVEQIIADTPFVKIAKERIKPKRHMKAWQIVLLALGSPIWLSLFIATAAVIFALYVSLWAVIIALWAVFASFIIGAVGTIPLCIIFVIKGYNVSCFAMIAAGFVLAGLSIFMFFGCKAATKGIIKLTKKIALWIKNCFIGREEA